ncbi:HlyD family efflux transporter periplasmic adaptor subunit [Pseudomonas chlororaphis]|uniref:HlyD family type I secretion membrane fusion protein n=1 Tax=Pseudomonas chlororaphis TaxID=587753 RepID=A0AAX3FV09_9PSED|nr:HlyD family efflux transporter periplasmic adaptor subunit [Pseudomonas chlororaphis]AZC46409.1 Type I secretion membrane fusion protein, HlyD family [Pseudomonas chlororaphis subsp. piscium]AZC59399.1 Type I secretion membrane fusion protein, HlyD family [Pseudomonas chlororaphis subsp. piscium]WDG71915.1 HlyD family efflux transporter periplasmic adaptor subunit [Pseudomonas chlororaphis]WDH30301.1 HlyD family efflux transporter periplasmic adaptor subunit [Pseudomonas chlororaphis]WDH704
MPHTSIAPPLLTEPPRNPLRAADTQQVEGFGLSEKELPNASRLVWSLALALLAFATWAWYFKLDEVSTGTGKVIASSKEQVIKSLEGGVLASLHVQEGNIVEKGQVLAQLDPTRIESAVEESASRSRAAQATSARLMAEVNNTPLRFPQEVLEEPDLVKAETALFQSRRESQEKSLSGLNEAMRLIRSELQLTTPLVTRGAASTVEVLRLKRQLNELQNKYTDIQTQYLVKAREELAKANAEIEAQQSVTRGRNDSLTRLTFTSPVRGIIKDIEVNTVGGVIPPNGQLMRIVPLDERLQVETRIAPRDIAYIHPGQAATVKISAYDYSIYGGLPGKVALISPDTLQDDVHRDVYYYRVYILTDSDSLLNKTGKRLPIVPGMIATVDIHTGEKTVLSYLMKPLNKGREALRER